MEIKQTSFRLSTDLLKRLRIAARRENRSLNNFVESALIDAAYNVPNDETPVQASMQGLSTQAIWEHS